MLDRREFLKWTVATALVAAVPGALEACGGSGPASSTKSPAESLDQIITAAKKEGTLSWYSTAASPATQGLADAFKQKYGIDVQVYRGNSIEVAQRVETESKANRLGADVLVMDTPVMPALAPLLQNWNPPDRSAIQGSYKLPGYTLVRIYVGALGWNTNKVKGPTFPKDWTDFTDSQWKGRLGIADPSSTAVAAEWFDMMDHVYGNAYFQKLAANKPKVYTTGIAVAQAIAAGEVDFGYVYDYSILDLKSQQAPFDGIIPPETFATGSDVGVFTAAAHPNAGKLFYDFACSAAGQTALNTSGHSMATYPGITIVGAHSLTDVKKIYPTDFAQLQTATPSIQSRFNALFKS